MAISRVTAPLTQNDAMDKLNEIIDYVPAYGTCSTAASTAAKEVDCSDFELSTGCTVVIRFTNGNTNSAPTLNINSTGAKAIYYNGAAIGGEIIEADGTYMFVYNGTQWDYVGAVGGGSTITSTSVTIAVADWSNYTCTKSVSGVTASNTVIVTYAVASRSDYLDADIYCSAQASGALTFTCATTPTSAVTVNVMIIDE